MVGDIMQPTHLLFVLLVALLVLGPKRLPEVGRTLGSGLRDFRQALSGESSDRARAQEPEQVPSTAHGPENQPDFTSEHEVIWPDEAVGPTTYDEPVEAASAAAGEPTHASAAAGEPTQVQPAHATPAHAQPVDHTPLDEASLRASAEATRIVEPSPSSAASGSTEPQTGSSEPQTGSSL